MTMNSWFANRFLSQSSTQKVTGYKNFNYWFLSSILFVLCLGGGINYLVDPYDIYKTPNFWGINHQKIEKGLNDRLFKAVDIIRKKPVSIFLGSSRTKQGLDPSHQAFSQVRPTYNLAIDGANVYEMRRYLEHAIKNQPEMKTVIVGLDFFMFNEFLENQPGFAEYRLEKSSLMFPDIVNSLWSIDTLKVSKETIKASLNNPATEEKLGKNGFIPQPNLAGKDAKLIFEKSVNQYFRVHYQYQLSQNYLGEFQKIVDLCQQNNINLIVFISPSHATQWEAIKVTQQTPIFEEWKRTIVNIMPVWDFSGYNSITTEPINDKMTNYTDASHYTKQVGDLVLNRILNNQTDTVPDDFGVLITPQNIESHLAKIRTTRQQWAEKNSEEVKLVKQVKRNFESKQSSKP